LHVERGPTPASLPGGQLAATVKRNSSVPVSPVEDNIKNSRHAHAIGNIIHITANRIVFNAKRRIAPRFHRRGYGSACAVVPALLTPG